MQPGIGLGEEYVAPDEGTAIAQIDAMVRAQVEHDYPPGVRPARRDQHPKAHGCVRAEFTVDDHVPEQLRHGLFAKPGTYPAWIRFSSSSVHVVPDAKRDAHGMAIKVCGVEGEKVLPDERNETTHDFITANSKVFFVRSAVDNVTFVKAFTLGNLFWSFFFGWNPFGWRVHEFINVLRATRQAVYNPLQIQYWSQTPYKLGPHAVKYSARSLSVKTDMKPVSSADNFLEQAMARQLGVQEAAFEFLLQRQTDPVKMPVEDPTIVWDEAASPYEKVATIRIPPQTFDSAAQKQFGENLSYTPWHALPEHRPLGNTNRIRRVVYESISTLRHELNGVARREPTGNEVF